MRQAARMLGWATNLIGLIVVCTLALVGYSLIQMLIYEQPINIREMNITGYDRGVRYSIPFEVNNTSSLPFQDVSYSINISSTNTEVTGKEVYVPDIPGDKTVNGVLVLDLDLIDLPEEATGLLLSDSELDLETKIRFMYAGLITFSIKPSNSSMYFGAPLHNLSAATPDVRYHNSTHHGVYVPISFENHSPLKITKVSIIVLNEKRQMLTSRMSTINVPPMSGFHYTFILFMENRGLQRVMDAGYIELIFETSDFRFRGVEIPYG